MGPIGFWREIAALAAAISVCAVIHPAGAQTPNARIDEALQNITALVRPGRVGYATVWDGNKYVQCRRLSDRALRCEAAGATLQPSLKRILVPERQNRLTTLGWTLDPSFGNYVQIFPPGMATASVADHILRTLTEVYDAQVPELELQTAWVVDIPCPPRNGPGQNLAGIVSDAPQMRATALRSCLYKPDPRPARIAASAQMLIEIYGTTVAAEIQRLRVNSDRKVYVVFSAGIGYIQCMPQTSPPTFYCEAQSAESWPALAAVLTPERIAKLRDAGYTEPGRAPNYSKSYPLGKFTDAAVAGEILTLLYDVYGYAGAVELKISTE